MARGNNLQVSQWRWWLCCSAQLTAPHCRKNTCAQLLFHRMENQMVTSYVLQYCKSILCSIYWSGQYNRRVVYMRVYINIVPRSQLFCILQCVHNDMLKTTYSALQIVRTPDMYTVETTVLTSKKSTLKLMQLAVGPAPSCPPHISLVTSPRAPPGEKRSGERSRISWAYSPKR